MLGMLKTLVQVVHRQNQAYSISKDDLYPLVLVLALLVVEIKSTCTHHQYSPDLLEECNGFYGELPLIALKDCIYVQVPDLFPNLRHALRCHCDKRSHD